MATSFKCLIQFNNNKYRIGVHSNNDLTFGEVLKQIKQITGETCISRETHSFEIFDIDFNEYLLINSDKEMIENLSRIRVSPKTKSYENDMKEKLNNKTENEAKVSDSYTAQKSKSINTSLNCKIKENSSQEFNNNNDIIFKYNENNCDSKRICDFILIKYINHFIEHFKTDESIAWQMVSSEMIKNGFNHFSIHLCETQFNCLLSKFIEVLMSYKDYNNACNDYYLFYDLISMNFYPSLDSEMSRLVEKWKNQFDKKIKDKEVFDSIERYTNSETQTDIIDEIETKSFESQLNEKSEENEAFHSINSYTNSEREKGITNEDKHEMISLMINLINENSSCFKVYPNIDKFRLLSDLMQENGYYDCDEKVCRDSISGFNGYFVETLRNSQSYEIACDLCPLFELFYESYNNLKPFVNNITYNEVMVLRKKLKLLRNTKGLDEKLSGKSLNTSKSTIILSSKANRDSDKSKIKSASSLVLSVKSNKTLRNCSAEKSYNTKLDKILNLVSNKNNNQNEVSLIENALNLSKTKFAFDPNTKFCFGFESKPSLVCGTKQSSFEPTFSFDQINKIQIQSNLFKFTAQKLTNNTSNRKVRKAKRLLNK